LGWNTGYTRKIFKTPWGEAIEHDGKTIFLIPDSPERIRTLNSVYYEVWIKKIYDEFEVKGEHVIDVGALFGETGIYFLQRGARFVTMYEPGYTFKYIEGNMSLNGNYKEKYEAKNIAVTGTNEVVNINEEFLNYGKTSSFSESDNELRNTSTLSDIAVQDAILKFDTEGSEYETFANADYNTVRKFKAIMMEFHDMGYRVLVNKFEACGFEITRLNKDDESGRSGMLYAKRLDSA